MGKWDEVEMNSSTFLIPRASSGHGAVWMSPGWCGEEMGLTRGTIDVISDFLVHGPSQNNKEDHACGNGTLEICIWLFLYSQESRPSFVKIVFHIKSTLLLGHHGNIYNGAAFKLSPYGALLLSLHNSFSRRWNYIRLHNCLWHLAILSKIHKVHMPPYQSWQPISFIPQQY